MVPDTLRKVRVVHKTSLAAGTCVRPRLYKKSELRDDLSFSFSHIVKCERFYLCHIMPSVFLYVICHGL